MNLGVLAHLPRVLAHAVFPTPDRSSKVSDLLFFLRDYDFFIRSPAARRCYRQPVGKIRKAYQTLREALTRNDLVEAGVQLEHISCGDVGDYIRDFVREFYRRVPDSAAHEINRRVNSEAAW